jgi:histidinol phosphatase-like enzyme (inositol monophosphatase family)
MHEPALAERLAAARRMASLARELVLRYFIQDFEVQRKADNSPVTIADREAELLLRREIQTAFPDDAIVGEEFGPQQGSSPFRWILDPIDGTKSFIAGVPLFGTLIGVEQNGECVIGMIDFPGLDRRVYAARGQGAWWQVGNEPPRRARVSECPRLRDALYVTTEIASFAARDAAAAHQQLEESAWYARTWGDCYGYFLVATGRAAVMVDPILNLWDAAALLPILLEAGGTFTDWSGQTTIHSGDAIATNGRVLDEVLAITRPFSAGERPTRPA